MEREKAGETNNPTAGAGSPEAEAEVSVATSGEETAEEDGVKEGGPTVDGSEFG
jgi:hypothetical protein